MELATPDHPEISIWANSDLLWDVVESIEAVGSRETWDLCVPEIENFIVNDFAVHNSGAVEEDVAGVMLLYEDKEAAKVAKATLTYSTGAIKTWLKGDKFRYGASGLYLPLIHHKKYTRFDLCEMEAEPYTRRRNYADSDED